MTDEEYKMIIELQKRSLELAHNLIKILWKELGYE